MEESIMRKLTLDASKGLQAEKWQKSIEGKSKDAIGKIILEKVEMYLLHSSSDHYFPKIKVESSELFEIVMDDKLTFNQKAGKVFGRDFWRKFTLTTQGKIYSFFETVSHPPVNNSSVDLDELAKRMQQRLEELETVL